MESYGEEEIPEEMSDEYIEKAVVETVEPLPETEPESEAAVTDEEIEVSVEEPDEDL